MENCEVISAMRECFPELERSEIKKVLTMVQDAEKKPIGAIGHLWHLNDTDMFEDLTFPETKELVLLAHRRITQLDEFEVTQEPDIKLAQFSFRCGQMLKIGMPLLRALRVLEVDEQDPEFKLGLTKTTRAIEAGADISEAMEKAPELFNPAYRTKIELYAFHDRLADALLELAGRECWKTIDNPFGFPSRVGADAHQVKIWLTLCAGALGAGATLLRAVEASSKARFYSARFEPCLGEIVKDVTAGIPLAHAIEEHREFFNRSVIAMIDVGEKKGTLCEVLTTIAAQ